MGLQHCGKLISIIYLTGFALITETHFRMSMRAFPERCKWRSRTLNVSWGRRLSWEKVSWAPAHLYLLTVDTAWPAAMSATAMTSLPQRAHFLTVSQKGLGQLFCHSNKG